MQLHNVKKILIIQLGDIGDVVWTTPTLWAVKDAYPDAQVSILVKEGYGALLEEDPSLDKVFEVRGYKGGLLSNGREQIRFLRALRREGFSLAIDLRAGDRGAIIAYLTGAPMRVSLLYRGDVPFWRNPLFTHLIDPPPQDKRIRGAAEQSLRIVRGLGIESRETTPRLWVSKEANIRVRELLQHEKITDLKKWITLNPFSRWGYKEWGLDKWKEIIDWLWSKYQIATVIIGAPEERERAVALAKQGSGLVFNLTGKTTLSDLMGVLNLSFLHIGVDSAAPHIAAAVGTPTITLYGPSDWYDWAPVGDNHKIVLPDGECVPCHKKGCEDKGWSRCLDELAVEQVEMVIGETIDGWKLKSGIQ
ncbi:MAG: glycosyltransferase family 9 protein [Thermodesulfobacteriota bacterium]|nr:glycosyltransferase family 9 protein [Thermodesulfobacteriota bacterium]